MRKIMSLFSFLLIFNSSYSQNVGIGTMNPQSGLDINADLALRSTDIIINSVYSYSLDVNSLKQTNYKLKSPTLPVGNFIIAGISGSVEGRIITLTNRSGFSMEIYNEDLTASASDRIQTGTGSTIAVYNGGAITLQYDGTDQRWSVKSMHNNSLDYFGGGGSSYWDLSGINISNNNPGNVGIGTTSPGYKLDVRGDARLQGNGLYGNGINGGALRIETNNFPGTQSQFINIDGQQIQSMGNPDILTATTPKNLYINPFGGNVGIGIAGDAPYKLSIYQPVIETNNNTYVLQLRGKNPMLDFKDEFNTSRGYIKGITNRDQTPHFSREGIEIGTGGGDIYFTASGYLPALMINGTNNNVGIGTNSPAEKLSVNGTIRSKEVVVEIINWPDYVFDHKYKLQTLEEIEQYIIKNKRLPGIASAAEIQTNGLKVGELQTKMMEKIEELTLYIIELKKEMQVLQSQILLTKPKN